MNTLPTNSEHIKKIAAVIKSKCKQLDSPLKLSKCLDLASRMHGYLDWNHFTKRGRPSDELITDWDKLKAPYMTALTEEKLPQDVYDAILSALYTQHSRLNGADADGDPKNLQALLRELKTLHKAGDHLAIHRLIVELPPEIFHQLPPAFFELVDEVIKLYPEAALSLVHVFPPTGSPEKDTQIKLDRLERALGQAGDAEGLIHLTIALTLIDAKLSGAWRHIEQAMESGEPHAFYVAGMFKQSGVDGESDLNSAMDYFIEGFEGYGDSGCKMAAIKLLITDNTLDPEAYGYDAIELLRELIEDDEPEADEAADILRMIQEAKSLPRLLPYTVTPVSGKRPKLIKETLTMHLGLGSEAAGKLTAALHGFDSWNRMLNACNDPRTIKGPFDEECDAPAFNARKRLQIGVVRMHTDLDEYLAEIVVKLLKATSKEGRPSLRYFKSTAGNRLFPYSTESMDGMLTEFLSTLGIEGSPTDFFNSIRAGFPIDPEVWCEYLQTVCSWNIQQVKPAPTKSGSKVAVVNGEGRSFDVYMVAAAYDPGDKTDLLVDETMKAIDQANRDAILLFRKVIVYKHHKLEPGLLYCGRMRIDGRWWDFTTRPGGGLNEAISQVGRFTYPPSEEFVRQFGFSDFLQHGANIAANSEEGPDGPINFGLVTTASGWSQFLRA